MEEWIRLLSNVSKNKNIPFEIIKLRNYKEAQQTGSPFGTFGICYNGDLKTLILMPEKKFEKFIEEIRT